MGYPSPDRMKIGYRVGLFCSSAGDACSFLGFGRFSGYAVPADGLGAILSVMATHGISTAVFTLDSGEVVYGIECWWGAEEAVNESLQAYLTPVKPVGEVRNGYL